MAGDDTELIWQEVPPEAVARARNYGTAYAEQAQRLRAAPGRSAIIKKFKPEDDENARVLTNSIKSGRLKAFRPPGAFGALTHTENGTVNVYAWYGTLSEEEGAGGGGNG